MGGMKKLSGFMQEWRALKRSRPGYRFQDRHERIRNSGDENGVRARVMRLVIAAVSFVIGVALTVIPGPAVVFFLITAALLASESLRLARWLDIGEVCGRKTWNGAHRTFHKLPLAGKITAAGIGFLMAVAGAWVTYTTFMNLN
jgi:uncharacterized membrane protein YbaN (DUF454 family)